jgi:hypothetical protein
VTEALSILRYLDSEHIVIPANVYGDEKDKTPRIASTNLTMTLDDYYTRENNKVSRSIQSPSHHALRPLHLVHLPLPFQRAVDYPGSTTRRRKGPTSTARPPLAVFQHRAQQKRNVSARPIFSRQVCSTCPLEPTATKTKNRQVALVRTYELMRPD